MFHVQGPAVYANYGRAQDLRLLELQGLSLRGKVLLVRLGQIPAATKARLAETRGAAALVLFPDPARVAPPRGDQEPWPSSRWLPDSAARRDTLLEEPGDPLSPGVPSSSPVAKLPLRNASLPAILCQPVGYRDALIMLGQLEGNRCPDAWVPSSGRCRLGDGSARNSIRVVVQNELMSGNVTNVLATIRGNIEPDRYVVLGSPRDGWGPGAHAPGSGTVQLLEASRVLSELHRSGTWSPRRSIVFASWGGHRYGSIGATEWVEEQVNELQSGAVAYINCHQCTDGGDFE
ncbi:aminopeptidase NAALADL1 [Ixodes scapularis]|uniref:aminopeptidase NAALADL1 n=1 Tax=Ixodes scapularis TaxID=6945 RepID=UPI001C38319D|nr:aminopeptidase NAALADL1 [Ixodes scapularis]